MDEKDKRIVELESSLAKLEKTLNRAGALHESCELFKKLFSRINDLAYICDTDGNIIFVNDVFEKYSGHRPEEFFGKPFAPLFDDENLEKAKDVYARTLAGEAPVFELYFKDTGVLCEYKNIPVIDAQGVITGVLGIARDISERKESEERLRSQRDIARNYLDAARVIFLVIGSDQKVSLVNRRGCQVLGLKEEDIIGRNWFDNFVPPPVRERDRGAFLRFISGESNGYERFEGPVLACSGAERMIAWQNTLIRDERGVSALSSGTDITELKAVEEDLNKYRGNLEAIFRSVKDAIITIDTGMRVIEINEAAGRICGFRRDSLGNDFSKLKALCSFRCVESLKEAIASKEPVEVYRLECRKAGRHGQTVTLSIYPLLDGSGEIVGAVLVMKDETRLDDLERDLNERKQLHNIIGKNRRMQEIYSLVEDLADVQTTVLITGESGTGKELVAEALHYGGARSDKPLVKVNCAGLAEQILESELFGHVKGAFTGAVKDRLGRFQLADGGTIFLDEVGDISREMQLRLLRVLQHREFERVGDSRTIKVDVRIIAATNKDLLDRVSQGRFREDLYYRLKVVEIALPPLRERLDDLPLLTDYFIKKFNKKFGKEIKDASEDVQKIFLDYRWPGNIRELEHAIEHAFIICRDDTIYPSHLPAVLRGLVEGIRTTYYRGSNGDERGEIVRALEKTAWNKAKAARILGMSRRTIYRKIGQYGIMEEGKR